jgi:hypothetical protein
MTLFRQLYWTIFWAFLCFVLFSYVYSSFKISVEPFAGSFVGTICLQRPLPAGTDIIKMRLGSVAFSFISTCFLKYFNWKVRARSDSWPNIQMSALFKNKYKYNGIIRQI